MIKIEKTDTWGWEHAIRGMRNPMNSWERSDSYHTGDCKAHEHCKTCDMTGNCVDGMFWVGENDIALMTKLIHGGTPHRKFLRQIFVSVDITAPLYWWKEFDTYKVGTTANSCSTMHKLTAKPFEREDFSFEKADGVIYDYWFENLIDDLNEVRNAYVNYEKTVADGTFKKPVTKKDLWYALVQMLPSSYNQKRTITMTYENLLNIYEYRRNHKLDEWRQFCDWILNLPFGSYLKEGVTHEPG